MYWLVSVVKLTFREISKRAGGGGSQGQQSIHVYTQQRVHRKSERFPKNFREISRNFPGIPENFRKFPGNFQESQGIPKMACVHISVCVHICTPMAGVMAGKRSPSGGVQGVFRNENLCFRGEGDGGVKGFGRFPQPFNFETPTWLRAFNGVS